MKQSQKIIFRTSPELKAFVREFAEKNGMDTSDFLRLILHYYFMAFFTKQGSYREIRERFFQLYPPDEKSKKKGK
jgi:hypothetical protein